MSEWTKIGDSKMWKPEKKDDEIVGLYVGMQEDVGENHSTVYELFCDNSEAMSFWGSSVLDTKMKRVPIGHEVRVVYLGQQPSEKRKGKMYHNYEVFHRIPEGRTSTETVEDDGSVDPKDIPF